jgi:hypothetical protein
MERKRNPGFTRTEDEAPDCATLRRGYKPARFPVQLIREPHDSRPRAKRGPITTGISMARWLWVPALASLGRDDRECAMWVTALRA